MTTDFSTPSHIEMTVLARARAIRVLRLVVSGMTLAVLLGASALWGIGREVFVAEVFHNMPPIQDVTLVMRFFAEAFLTTHLLVQILTLAVVVTVVWFLYEALRTVRMFTAA